MGGKKANLYRFIRLNGINKETTTGVEVKTKIRKKTDTTAYKTTNYSCNTLFGGQKQWGGNGGGGGNKSGVKKG